MSTARGFTNAMEFTIKGGLFGASAAFSRGVHRHRIREAVIQSRVNQYAAAVLNNRASAIASQKDLGRDSVAAAVFARFDSHS